MSVIHVYPVNDTFPHVTEGLGCPCKPDIQDEDGGGTLIIHHSYDGRENVERPVESA